MSQHHMTPLSIRLTAAHQGDQSQLGRSQDKVRRFNHVTYQACTGGCRRYRACCFGCLKGFQSQFRYCQMVQEQLWYFYSSEIAGPEILTGLT